MLPALSEGGVHVWHCGLEATIGQIKQYRSVLSVEERSRASRFRLPRDEHRYTMAHAVLRQILGLYLECAPENVPIRTLPFGKPVVRDSFLAFNLSHCEGKAVIAVARRQVGVDIERLRNVSDAEPLARSFFSEVEASYISACSPGSRSKEFARCWTRKEAYLKGLGLGLSVPLGSFVIPMGTPESRDTLGAGGEVAISPPWTFCEIEIKGTYLVSVAVNGEVDHISQFFWPAAQERCSNSLR
jgi:4'-phosphopantetheinyl transferase